MKRTFLSVKELAHELGISPDSVYRAYRKKEIPAAQICRMIRFDLEKVRRAMERKANAMPNSQCRKRAPGGGSRRCAATSPPLGKTGALIAQASSKESRMTGAFSQTIDWLAFTIPHATVDEVIQIVGGDWITIEHGFRGYPICSMTHNGRQGVGKLGTGAHRNPTEVHVDLSAGIVSTWEEHKLRQVLGWIFDKQGHVTRFSAQSTSPPGAEKTL